MQLDFELEVCRLGGRALSTEASCGVRRKRLKGDAMLYKKMAEDILSQVLVWLGQLTASKKSPNQKKIHNGLQIILFCSRCLTNVKKFIPKVWSLAKIPFTVSLFNIPANKRETLGWILVPNMSPVLNSLTAFNHFEIKHYTRLEKDEFNNCQTEVFRTEIVRLMSSSRCILTGIVGVGSRRCISRRYSVLDRAWSSGIQSIGKLKFFEDGFGTPEELRELRGTISMLKDLNTQPHIARCKKTIRAVGLEQNHFAFEDFYKKYSFRTFFSS